MNCTSPLDVRPLVFIFHQDKRFRHYLPLVTEQIFPSTHSFHPLLFIRQTIEKPINSRIDEIRQRILNKNLHFGELKYLQYTSVLIIIDDAVIHF